MLGIATDSSKKVFHFPGIGWAAAAGDSEDCEIFYDWVDTNFRKKKRPRLGKSFEAIFVCEKTGKAFKYWDRCIAVETYAPATAGSGGVYAHASMKIGFDAETAVSHAIVCDHRSGGKVQCFRTRRIKNAARKAN